MPHPTFHCIYTEILLGEEDSQVIKTDCSTNLPKVIAFFWNKEWRNPCLGELLKTMKILVVTN